MIDPALIVNPVKRKLAADEPVLMMSLRQLRTPDAAMIVRECGFDGFYVDCEHGSYTRQEMAALCTAGLMMGLMPAVRVPGHQPEAIAAALDGGALAVIVPHVSSAEEARAAVRAAKYPPAGARSVAGLGPATRYRGLPLAELVRLVNDLTLVIAMLETPAGIENAAAIAAEPGVDALMLGPADLSVELGVPGELKHPRIRQAWFSALAAARRHGKHFVAGAGGPDAAEMLAQGARILMGGTDISYLMAAARDAAAKLRSTRRSP